MSAYISTAFIGVCDDCDSRSGYGLPIQDAEDWVSVHNADRHGATK